MGGGIPSGGGSSASAAALMVPMPTVCRPNVRLAATATRPCSSRNVGQHSWMRSGHRLELR